VKKIDNSVVARSFRDNEGMKTEVIHGGNLLNPPIKDGAIVHPADFDEAFRGAPQGTMVMFNPV
jgi:hypothetical protein